MEGIKKRTISGILYKFAERGFAQLFGFFVQIFLARILMPDDFGTIALLTVFMAVMNVVVTFGYTNSLIIDKKSNNIDFSTCFYFSLILSICLYVIIFFSASSISSFFYNKNNFDILVRVIALRLPISAIYSLLQSYAAKMMKFKYIFYSTSSGAVVAGIIGISMALLGYGIWALVAQYLFEFLVGIIVLWSIVRWKPIRRFSIKRLKHIYDFGWKIMAVGLLDTFYGQIRSLVVARQYSRSSLAYYNRGLSFPSFCSGFMEQTISGVMLPSLSSCNDKPEMMKAIVKRTIKCSTYVLCSLMCVLVAIANSLVVFVLTEKWLDCTIFLQIGCVAYFFRPLQIINSCAVKACGRGGLLLKLNFLKKVIGLVLLFICAHISVVAIAWSFALTNIISTAINIYPNKQLLDYGYIEQLSDVFGNIILGVTVGLIVWMVSLIVNDSLISLLVQIVIGLVLFVSLSRLFKLEPYEYLIDSLFIYAKQVRKKYK